MPKNILNNLRKDPVGFIKLAFKKKIIGPLKYGKRHDYDAEKYWRDRFIKYGFSLKSVGNEGFSEEDNRRAYMNASNLFIGILKEEHIEFEKISALEIGVGTGFYTEILSNHGVTSYKGIDITDVNFSRLKNKYPDYTFVKGDITKCKLNDKFDLIIMIDVIEHIVNEEKLTFAMENTKEMLGEMGVLIISGIGRISAPSLFYIRSWDFEDLSKRFKGYKIKRYRTKKMPTLRYSNIFVIGKDTSPPL